MSVVGGMGMDGGVSGEGGVKILYPALGLKEFLSISMGALIARAVSDRAAVGRVSSRQGTLAL